MVNNFVNHEELRRIFVLFRSFEFVLPIVLYFSCVSLFFAWCFLVVVLIRFFFSIVACDNVFHVHVFFCWTLGFIAIDCGWLKYFLERLFWCFGSRMSLDLYTFSTGRFVFPITTGLLSISVTLCGPPPIGAGLCLWSSGFFRSPLMYTKSSSWIASGCFRRRAS